jgi:hypothetical protein
MASLSEKQLGVIMLATASVVAPTVIIWHYRFGDLGRAPALIIGVVSAIAVNALILVSLHLRDKRLGLPPSQNLVVFAVVFAVL